MFRKSPASKSSPDPAEPVSAGNCLNCATHLVGEFCHVCGQENEPPRPTFWRLLSELGEHVLGFDKKLLRTVGRLLFHPGYLTVQYLQGRRVRYISPFKLYFWITALFVFFSYRAFYIEDEQFQPDDKVTSGIARAISDIKDGERKALLQTGFGFDALPESSLWPFAPLASPLPATTPTSAATTTSNSILQLPDGDISVFGAPLNFKNLPTTVSEYESAQESLSEVRRDAPLAHWFKIKAIRLQKNPGDTLRGLIFGSLPNILILSVPALALLLTLTYVRPRRLFIEHLVWSLHTHTFTLLWLGLCLGILRLFAGSNLRLALERVPTGVEIFVITVTLVYHYRAARVVYGQHPLWTAVKGGCLTCGYGCIFSITLGLGILITIASILLNL